MFTIEIFEKNTGPVTGMKQYRSKLCILNMLMFTESKVYRIFTGSNKIHAPISHFANSFFTLFSRYDLN